MTVGQLRVAMEQFNDEWLVVIAPDAKEGVVTGAHRRFLRSSTEAAQRGTFGRQHVVELSANMCSWRLTTTK